MPRNRISPTRPCGVPFSMAQPPMEQQPCEKLSMPLPKLPAKPADILDMTGMPVPKASREDTATARPVDASVRSRINPALWQAPTQPMQQTTPRMPQIRHRPALLCLPIRSSRHRPGRLPSKRSNKRTAAREQADTKGRRTTTARRATQVPVRTGRRQIGQHTRCAGPGGKHGRQQRLVQALCSGHQCTAA